MATKSEKTQELEIWLRTYLFSKVKIINPNVRYQEYKGHNLTVAYKSFVAIEEEDGTVIKQFPKYLLLAEKEYRAPTEEEIIACYEYWRKKEGKKTKDGIKNEFLLDYAYAWRGQSAEMGQPVGIRSPITQSYERQLINRLMNWSTYNDTD